MAGSGKLEVQKSKKQEGGHDKKQQARPKRPRLDELPVATELRRQSSLSSTASSGLQENGLQDDGYVQEALHKQVIYQTEGKAQLSPAMAKVYAFVKENFDVPPMFDKRHRYGPLSGTSAEERLVVAFLDGQLQPKQGRDSAAFAKLCVECGEEGHRARDCPLGL
eukprot:TRINITY_DN11923_c0_g1_i1.p2 TRINITY_DN11923_c0_g1~~TRINITY_DN11923_c0_g1_i1.p2  ORF type:complete len:178 (-),score=60.54 TRINITY_DN11923_c0_g1_i1:604-1098(-)